VKDLGQISSFIKVNSIFLDIHKAKFQVDIETTTRDKTVTTLSWYNGKSIQNIYFKPLVTKLLDI